VVGGAAGQKFQSQVENALRCLVGIGQQISRNNAMNMDTLSVQPGITDFISLPLMVIGVDFTIHFDAKFCLGAIEVQNVRA
jgi:hypothetical protein